VFFKDVEWKALHCYIKKSPVLPEEPPTLGETMRMVGRLGGHKGMALPALRRSGAA